MVNSSATCGLDRVHVPDDVGHGDVRRRQFFNETIVSAHPGDRRVVTLLLEHHPRVLRNGLERIVIDLAPLQDRDLGVEEIHQLSENPALCLTTQAQQDEIVMSENPVHDHGDDSIIESDDAGEDVLTGLELGDQVLPQFILYGARLIS